MENIRRHHHFDEVIVTGLCPNGQYGAYHESEDGRVRGYGHTRKSAIRDLCDSRAEVAYDDIEVDHQAAKFDYQHDSRKHSQ